jgi:hypothetical protein
LDNSRARRVDLRRQGTVGRNRLTETAAGSGEVGLGLRYGNLRIGLVEPDQHVPCLHLLRIFY